MAQNYQKSCTADGYFLLDGEKHYPLPYDWHEPAGSSEKSAARKGGTWLMTRSGAGLALTATGSSCTLRRSGTARCMPIIEGMQQEEQILTGVYVGYEAEVRQNRSGGFRAVPAVGIPAGGNRAAYAGKQRRILLPDQLSIQQVASSCTSRPPSPGGGDGRFVYMPQNADHPEGEHGGVVIEDPRPLLDLWADGKAIFTLNGRQGAALT